MALLVSACGFSEPRKFVTINENCDTDGSFLIATLIGQRLRQQSSAIVLICCKQSLKFYEACGKKLGYNLIMSINKKSLVAIEKLRDAATLNNLDCNKLVDEIRQHVDTFKRNNMKNISIIFDDLMFYTYFGCAESDVIGIGMRLNKLADEFDELSIVIKIGLSDLHPYVTNNLEDLSDTSITVEKLMSGDFWDVDGKLRIKKVKNENGISKVESERSVLYYVGDHNIKIIAPGEHGLKI